MCHFRLCSCFKQFWPKGPQIRHFSTTDSPEMGLPGAQGEYKPTDTDLVQIVRSRRGPDILHNPWANKVHAELRLLFSFLVPWCSRTGASSMGECFKG